MDHLNRFVENVGQVYGGSELVRAASLVVLSAALSPKPPVRLFVEGGSGHEWLNDLLLQPLRDLEPSPAQRTWLLRHARGVKRALLKQLTESGANQTDIVTNEDLQAAQAELDSLEMPLIAAKAPCRLLVRSTHKVSSNLPSDVHALIWTAQHTRLAGMHHRNEGTYESLRLDLLDQAMVEWYDELVARLWDAEPPEISPEMHANTLQLVMGAEDVQAKHQAMLAIASTLAVIEEAELGEEHLTQALRLIKQYPRKVKEAFPMAKLRQALLRRGQTQYGYNELLRTAKSCGACKSTKELRVLVNTLQQLDCVHTLKNAMSKNNGRPVERVFINLQRLEQLNV